MTEVTKSETGSELRCCGRHLEKWICLHNCRGWFNLDEIWQADASWAVMCHHMLVMTQV